LLPTIFPVRADGASRQKADGIGIEGKVAAFHELAKVVVIEKVDERVLGVENCSCLHDKGEFIKLFGQPECATTSLKVDEQLHA